MNRLLLVGILLLICLSLVVASAGSLEVDGGTIQVFQYTASVPGFKTPENEVTKTATPTLGGEIPTEVSTPGKATLTPATVKPSQTLTEDPPASPTPSPTSKSTRPAPTVTPDTPPTPTWDGSKLVFTSKRGSGCENGGMVWIVVENRGAALGGPVEWELHLSNERIDDGTIQNLGSGESILITAPASGAGAYRFRLWQRPGFPVNPEVWSAEIRFDPAACAPAPEPPPTATPKLPQAEPSPSDTPPAGPPPTDIPPPTEPPPPGEAPTDTPAPTAEPPEEASTEAPTDAGPPADEGTESGQAEPDSTGAAP